MRRNNEQKERGNCCLWRRAEGDTRLSLAPATRRAMDSRRAPTDILATTQVDVKRDGDDNKEYPTRPSPVKMNGKHRVRPWNYVLDLLEVFIIVLARQKGEEGS